MSNGRLCTYDEYRSSGVEWIGDVPKEWEVLATARVTDLTTGDSDTQDAVEEGEYPFFVRSPTIEGSNKFLFDGEGVLTSGDGAGVGKIFHHHIGKFDFHQRVYLFHNFRRVTGRYCFYFLREHLHRVVLAGNAKSTVDSLRRPMLRMFPICLPSVEEQETIAEFLDYETAKIDALIKKQQQLIALLGEKRQAVISHAVTKGLNPNAPMRDSGVEWLGEVPEHWEITRLKYAMSPKRNAFVDGPFGSNLKSEHFVDDGTVFVIESGFATSGQLDESKLKRISEQHFATVSRSEACEGDIIIAKIGARYGMSSILPKLSSKALVSGNSLKLTMDSETMNVEYAHAFLQVLKACAAMDDDVNVTAQPALSLGGLKKILFLRPPLDEQAAIVAQLAERKGKLDDLIDSALLLSETLRERRTALISAAVTGKIDVRGWKRPSAVPKKKSEMEVA
ncbi:MAG: restriction endonuclease subunit S [Planctomycetota bacterium]